MSGLVSVYDGGEVENVTIGGQPQEHSLAVLGAGTTRNVRTVGAFAAGAQIAILGNDGTHTDLRADMGGDGILVAGSRNTVQGRAASSSDQGVVITGSNNEVEAVTNGSNEEALNITGARNQVKIRALSPGQNGITITGGFNRVTGHLWAPAEHGLIITGAPGNIVDLTIDEVGFVTTNTYDAVVIEGSASVRNRIRGIVTPRASGNTTRRAVYFGTGTADNHVTDLDLGNVSSYGTAPITDDGANDISNPDDATYGDNWNQ